MECKERIKNYWKIRSTSFLDQRREELHHPIAERWIREITEVFPAGKNLKILDVGCGTGFFTILLAKRGHQVTGIDLTPDMILHARELAKEEGADCEFHVMDAENPEYDDNTFDFVISRNLTWTLPDAQKAYKEWMRVLKPGGMFLICNECGGDNEKDEKWTEKIDGMTIYKDVQLKDMLEQAGFRNIQIHKREKGWLCITAQK